MSKHPHQPEKIDAYIAGFPPAVQAMLTTIRQTISHQVPDATETISYQIPAFRHNNKNLVYFAGWKNHVAMYPLPHGDAEFQKEISQYRHAKGSVHFPLDQPVPVELVKKIVHFHLKERE